MEEGLREGYKAVRVGAGGRLVSFIEEVERITQRRYSTEFFTEPKEGDGPLAVWTDQFWAVRFAEAFGSMSYDCRIYRCEYEPSNAKSLMCVAGGRLMSRSDLPKGTALAKRVRLVEMVAYRPKEARYFLEPDK